MRSAAGRPDDGDCELSPSKAPFRSVMVFPETAGTRSPGTMIPTRFSGSAAERDAFGFEARIAMRRRIGVARGAQ